MKDNMSNFFRGIGQIAAAIIVCVIFICISRFVLRGYFIDNAYPTALTYTEWADTFVSWFTIASVVCIILNILYVFFAAFVKGPFVSAGGWFIELIASIIIGLIFAIAFSSAAPEESSCITIAEALFVVEFFAAFFIGSFFADSFTKFQYNPILAAFNRGK
ncbi:MAG: hypothetical protein LUC97_03080 [Clostridiales bacterium]|nr:hypothetical protein [Clostridiales bacterium]